MSPWVLAAIGATIFLVAYWLGKVVQRAEHYIRDRDMWRKLIALPADKQALLVRKMYEDYEDVTRPMPPWVVTGKKDPPP